MLTIRLYTTAKTATLVSAFTHPRKLLSSSQGNVERLPNGDVFVGWGLAALVHRVQPVR